MEEIQKHFDQSGGDFLLSPGEYQGPLTVSRPCILDGAGSTLWAEHGPVLTITAPGVTIKNLRVEITGGADTNGTAVQCTAPSVTFTQVEVNGDVVGLSQEAPNWKFPRVAALGTFAADAENRFQIQLEAPADAEVVCRMKDLRIAPARLRPGMNTLTLTTQRLRDNTILYGEIFIQTQVTRRIYIYGKAVKGAPVANASAAAENAGLPQGSLPADPIVLHQPDEAVEALQRGQRVSLRGLYDHELKIVYEHQGTARPLEVDCYCFLLRDNGKASSDEDLVFFGNMESPDHAVRVPTTGLETVAQICLDRVGSLVQKIVLCYAIYGDDSRLHFSMVSGPRIRFFDGAKELYQFALSSLSDEKAVVAAEFYRYKGEWKLKPVGAGYRAGLAKLCESYGIQTE